MTGVDRSPRPRAPQTVIGRALAILGTFSVHEPSLTLTQISHSSGLPITTTHRLLAQAQEWGAVIRDTAGRYWIGLRIVELAALAPPFIAAALDEVRSETDGRPSNGVLSASNRGAYPTPEQRC